MRRLLPLCILFDLDGTLVDSLPGIEFSIREAFSACRLPAPSNNLRQLIGPPIRTILAEAGNIVEKGTLDALERAFRVSYDGEGWRKTVCYPDVCKVLQMMKEKGHRLFVVSNKPRDISLQILKREGLLAHFEVILTRDSRSPGFAGKEEMIRVLLEDRAIANSECLMVGDTTEDASAAASAGIEFAWMSHGYGSPLSFSISVAKRMDGFSEFLPLMTKEPVCD
jgi:phosphoglycolate phosphatase